MSVVILGTGSFLPEQVLTNHAIQSASDDFVPNSRHPDLHAWVMARSGIAGRHRCALGEGTSDMALQAIRRALADAGVRAQDVDLLVLATFTSDSRLPSTVSLVQQALGGSAKCLQLESACTGLIDAMLVAKSLMATVGYRTVVVAHTEAMSAVVDPQRFMMQTIFGDGAAALVLRDLPGSPYGIEELRTYTDASHCDWTWAPGGGTKHPITEQVLADRSQYISLDYRSIYRFAVEKMVDATYDVLRPHELTVDDIDWLIPHQTGRNIIADVAEELKIPPERVISCLEHTGNVSGASVGIALDEARSDGRLADGQRVVMSVVGGGMAWGAVSLIWRQPTSDGR